jgi:hypothetical protein
MISQIIVSVIIFWKDYLALTQCYNIASDGECQLLAAKHKCQTVLTNQKIVGFYCSKSCNLCSNISSSSLTCENLINDCGNSGKCEMTTYFDSIESIRCVCGSDKAGTYCSRGHSFSFIFKKYLNIMIAKLRLNSLYIL